MQLLCSCGQTITKDLCLISCKKSHYRVPADYPKYEQKNGFFYISKRVSKENNKWDDEKPAQILPVIPKTINVSLHDILLPIPIMPDGYGCCDWSSGANFNCVCGKTIGQMYLDCYEDKSLSFYEKDIIRKY